jgi:hypothetical protein
MARPSPGLQQNVAQREEDVGIPSEKRRNKAIRIIQQAVYKYPELFTEAQAQITAAVYVMCEDIVPFITLLGNTS